MLQRIVDLLNGRQRAVRNVKYVLRGVVTVPAGQMSAATALTRGEPITATVPPEDTRYEIERSLLIDFERGMIRKETTNQVWDPLRNCFFPTYTIAAFDGESVTKALPRDRNTSDVRTPGPNEAEYIEYGKGEELAALRDLSDLPVYFAHGVLLTASKLPQGIVQPIDPATLRVVEAGSDTTGSGPPAVVLENRFSPIAVVQYLIDMQRGGAILNARMLERGVPTTEIHVEDYREFQQNWLPTRWTVTVYHAGGDVRTATELQVIEDVSIDLPVDEDVFSLSPPPGAVVQNARGFFRVDADGVGRTRVTAASRGSDDQLPSAGVKAGSPWLLVAANGAAALLLLLLLWFRRRSRIGSQN